MKEWMDLVSQIRQEQFNVVVDLFSGPRTAILAWLSGAPVRYGEDVRKGLRGFLYNRPMKVVRDGRHLVEQKLDLVRMLIGDVPREAAYLNLFPTDKEQRAVVPLLTGHFQGNRRRIGMVPGAGSIWRIWPAERFAQLGDLLIKEYEIEIFLLGRQGRYSYLSKNWRYDGDKTHRFIRKNNIERINCHSVES